MNVKRGYILMKIKPMNHGKLTLGFPQELWFPATL